MDSRSTELSQKLPGGGSATPAYTGWHESKQDMDKHPCPERKDLMQDTGFRVVKNRTRLGPRWLLFIQSVFCLTTGPKPLPKRFLHIVRSRAFSFKWEYPLLFLRSSSSFLLLLPRLLPRLLVTSISPFIFPSITSFRRQFLRKMWPIQLAFRFRISCKIFNVTLI
jgi:hypothetical protein